MKKEISPAALLSVFAVVAFLAGLITWKVFFSEGAGSATHEQVLKARDRKEAKETQGEIRQNVWQETR